MRLPVLLLFLGAAGSALAQEPRRGPDIGVVVDRMDHRDVTISALRYGGMLLGASVGWSSVSAPHQTHASLTFRTGALSADNGGEQRTFVGATRLSHIRAVAPRVGAGLRLDAEARVFDHRYARGFSSEVFATAAVVLSPAAQWRSADGHTDAALSAAALALVLRPYSRVKTMRGQAWSFAGPALWRQATLEINRIAGAERRVAWRFGYALTLRAYRDASGMASVDNTARVTSMIRFGGRSR